jgi:hypothetical protein
MNWFKQLKEHDAIKNHLNELIAGVMLVVVIVWLIVRR